MNVTALIAAVRDRTGTSSTDGMLTTARITSLVNQANLFIATVHDWPWQQVPPVTFATVAGTADYTPPADWLRTSDLRVTAPAQNTDGMTFYSVMELNDRWSPQARGCPREYAVWGEKLRLAPTPDGVYTVTHRYIRVEPDLANGGDIPTMPAQFHPAIAEYATVLACRNISEEARANVAMAAFDRWLLIMHQDRRRSTAPQRVRVRPGNLV